MAISEMSIRDRGTLLSIFANQCYQPPETLTEPKAGITDLEPLKKFLNKPLPPTFIDVDGAQAYVMSDGKDVLIACRGTEPSEMNDVKADLDTVKVPHPLGGKVHRGFYREYEKVMPGIREALAKHNKKGDKEVWVCGHSLGGAMAVLVAVDLKPNGLQTFGQPRVGNKEFLKNIDFPYYRYVNNNDIVPRVPPTFLGFRHGGKLRYINHYGNIRKCTSWQRTKDKVRGHWAAIKKLKPFDSLYDHFMHYYYTYVSNMDDTGDQIPK